MSSTLSQFLGSSKNMRKWIGLAIFVALLFSEPILISHLWSNAGFLLLSHVKSTASSLQPQQNIETKSQQLLHRAAGTDNDNLSAHRGLGWLYAIQGEKEKAADEWLIGGYRVTDFAERGEVLRTVMSYEDAITWYGWATWLKPELGDLWYNIGFIYEKLESWDKVVKAYEYGLSLSLVEIGESDIYYRLGKVLYEKIAQPDPDAALKFLDTAIDQDWFVMQSHAVEAHMLRARILRDFKRELEALHDYEWVIAQQPDHYWAYVSAGTLYWQSYENAVRAESLLMTAITILPERPEAYLRLGRLYQDVGRLTEAIKLFEQVIDFDPQNTAALKQLDKLTILREKN